LFHILQIDFPKPLPDAGDDMNNTKEPKMIRPRHANISRCVRIVIAAFLMVLPPHSLATAPAVTGNVGDIVFISVTDDDIRTLGPMPLDRRLYAQAIVEARNRGASAMLIKFFFDRSTPSDDALADAMKTLPTFLQQDFKAESTVAPSGDTGTVMSGILSGANPTLFAASKGVGFVTARSGSESDRIELVAYAKDKRIESLQLLGAEALLHTQAVVTKQTLTLGKLSFALDAQGRAVCAYQDVSLARPVALHDFLAHKGATPSLAGKLVVLGYTASDSPTVQYDSAKLPVHQAFYQQLACLAGIK